MERARRTARAEPTSAREAPSPAAMLDDRSASGERVRSLSQIVADSPRLAAQRRALVALSPLAATSSGPVQLENARQKAARRRHEVTDEWDALDRNAHQLQGTRIPQISVAFTYAQAVPAGIQAVWRRFPDIETRLNDVGGDIYLLRAGAGRKNIANRGNLALDHGLNHEEAVAHRAEMALLSAELEGHRARVDDLQNDAVAWLVIAANLHQALTDALKVHADTRALVAAIGNAPGGAKTKGKPAAKMRDGLDILDGQWPDLADAILVRKPNQGQILTRLTNWTARHYEIVGQRSGDMMDLNEEAGPVATEVVGVLAAGDKVVVTPLEAVYRSEPFDNPPDHFSISWGLELGKATANERRTLTWLSSWELHAHCQLTRAAGPGSAITGYTMTPGAAHVKPTVRQRALGVSITVPQAFMTMVQNASQAELLGWLASNATAIAGPKMANWAQK